MEQKLDKKINAAFLLGVMGDMIGFGNGTTEFNGGNLFSEDNYGENFVKSGADYSSELVFNFIADGGFYNHPKADYTVSDDSIMLLANATAIIKWVKESNDTETDLDTTSLINFIRLEYIKLIKERLDLDKFERVYKGGLTTIVSLKKLMNGDDYRKFAYDDKAGGSGGSMRSMIFGTVFYKKEDVLKLIECCIESTCLTHPNAIAFLGSIVVALMTSFAMQGIEPNRWCSDMLEIIDSDIIDNYMRTHYETRLSFYQRDKKIFINKWRNYMEDKFDEYDYTYKKSKTMKYPSQRSIYYHTFSNRKKDIYPGAGGDDSTIIAYDCLMDSNGSWDKLVFYSMLHVGDSDTTGMIAGYLYGSYYGLNKVYNKMIDNMIDHKEIVMSVSKDICKIVV